MRLKVKEMWSFFVALAFLVVWLPGVAKALYVPDSNFPADPDADRARFVSAPDRTNGADHSAPVVSCRDSSGNLYLAWIEDIDGDGDNEVVVQGFTPSGNKIFTSDPLAAQTSDEVDEYGLKALDRDGVNFNGLALLCLPDGSLFVAAIDNTGADAHHRNIVYQKISSSGQRLWGLAGNRLDGFRALEDTGQDVSEGAGLRATLVQDGGDVYAMLAYQNAASAADADDDCEEDGSDCVLIRVLFINLADGTVKVLPSCENASVCTVFSLIASDTATDFVTDFQLVPGDEGRAWVAIGFENDDTDGGNDPVGAKVGVASVLITTNGQRSTIADLEDGNSNNVGDTLDAMVAMSDGNGGLAVVLQWTPNGGNPQIDLAVRRGTDLAVTDADAIVPGAANVELVGAVRTNNNYAALVYNDGTNYVANKFNLGTTNFAQAKWTTAFRVDDKAVDRKGGNDIFFGDAAADVNTSIINVDGSNIILSWFENGPGTGDANNDHSLYALVVAEDGDGHPYAMFNNADDAALIRVDADDDTVLNAGVFGTDGGIMAVAVVDNDSAGGNKDTFMVARASYEPRLDLRWHNTEFSFVDGAGQEFSSATGATLELQGEIYNFGQVSPSGAVTVRFYVVDNIDPDGNNDGFASWEEWNSSDFHKLQLSATFTIPAEDLDPGESVDLSNYCDGSNCQITVTAEEINEFLKWGSDHYYLIALIDTGDQEGTYYQPENDPSNDGLDLENDQNAFFDATNMEGYEITDDLAAPELRGDDIAGVNVAGIFESGGQITVTTTIKNEGLVDAQDVTVRFYLTQWPDFLMDDDDNGNGIEDGVELEQLLARTTTIVLGETRVDIPAGDVRNVSEDLTIPVYVFGNFYRVYVVPDPDNVIGEWDHTALASGEDNNVDWDEDDVATEGSDAMSTDFVITGHPDLMLTDFQTDAREVIPGDSIEIFWRVHNVGGVDAPASTIRVYLSQDQFCDPATDIFLDEIIVDPLGIGESKSDTATVTIPTDITPGTWYIVGRVDPVGGEIFLANNDGTKLLECPGDALCGTSEVRNDDIGDDDLVAENGEYAVDPDDTTDLFDTIMVNPLPLPNLQVLSLSLNPSTVEQGGMVTASFVVANLGDAGAGISQLAFYLSTDTVLDADDTDLGAVVIPALGVGQTESGRVNLDIAADLEPGSYYILAVVDDENAVEESNEADNIRAASLNVVEPGLPDLSIPVYVVDKVRVQPGESVTVSYAVQNGPGAASAATTIRFLLSADDQADDGDTVLASAIVPALEPNESNVNTISIDIPEDVDTGSYYLLAQVDPNNIVTEADETNNVVASTLEVYRVLEPPVIDISVTNVAGYAEIWVEVRSCGDYCDRLATVAIQADLGSDETIDYSFVPGMGFYGWVTGEATFAYPLTVVPPVRILSSDLGIAYSDLVGTTVYFTIYVDGEPVASDQATF